MAKKNVAAARKRTGRPALAKPRRAAARKGRGGGKTVIRQDGLGQQTSSRVNLTAGKADPRAKIIKAICEPSFYNRSDAYDISGLVTGQQVWSYTYFAAQAALKQIADYVYAANTPLASTQTSPPRFLLEGAILKQDFVNNSTAPVTRRIYHCSQSRDTWNSSTNPMTYVTSGGVPYAWDGSPTDAIYQGLAAMSGTASGNRDTANTPGTNPGESQIFKNYFKIHKTTEVQLAQGSSHSMETHKSFNRMIDASVYSSTYMVGLMGITEFLVYQVIGDVVRDTSANVFTTSIPSIGVVESISYKYTMAFSATRNVLSINNLEQEAGNTLEQINPGSGQVEDVAIAQ